MRFQSSPTSKGGRYIVGLPSSSTSNCFNPRPPRKVGATDASEDDWTNINVSILAHLERWALLDPIDCPVARTLFQSSPTSKGGRYRVGTRHIDRYSRFNPRPPRKVGATCGSRGRRDGSACFNPRPPRKVGATGATAQTILSGKCFNPRPPRKVGATP